MEETDSTSIESNDSATSGVEKTREQSEKQRESYKKAQAQIQRSQKDEKKAKGDNEDLFTILQRFIQNPYYEELIPLVTEMLHRSIPSRYILTLIALFYPEATIHLLTAIGRQQDIHLLLALHHEKEEREFQEEDLHPTIRTWMSSWVHAGQLYITHPDMSIIMQKKLHTFIKEDPYLIDVLAQGLMFFFTSRHLRVQKKMMLRYAEHITREYIVALDVSLTSREQDLLDIPTIDDRALFGIVAG